MNNQKQMAPLVLDKFLGFYTEASPESLPEGVSPLAINDDFVVGGVLPRPGKRSVYQLSLFGYAQTATDNGGGGGGGGGTIDRVSTNAGTSSSASISGTPSHSGEVALLIEANGTNNGPPAAPSPGSWTHVDDPNGSAHSSMYTQFLSSASAITPSQTLAGPIDTWASMLIFFGSSNGIGITIPQKATFISGAFGAGNHNAILPVSTSLGSGILVVVATIATFGGIAPVVTDSVGNPYTLVAQITSGGGASIAVLWSPNVPVGNPTMTFNLGSGFVSGTALAYEVTGVGTSLSQPWVNPQNAAGAPSGIYATVPLAHGQFSDGLNCTDYGFNVDAASTISGVNIDVTAGVTNFGFPGLFLSASLIYHGSVIANVFPDVIIFPNGTADVIASFSIDNASIGNVLTPAIVNDVSFGVQFQYLYNGTVGSTRTARLAGAKVQITSTGSPSLDFNYLKTFEQEAGEINTLALDDSGTMWQEDALNNPGVLKKVYNGIFPDTFAQSDTLDNREFIAFSNLLNGTDIPRTYDGVNFDRLSQVGPGAPPTASTTSSGSNILSITQNPPVPLLVGPHDWLLVSDSPSDHGTFGTPATPGNVMAIIFRSATLVPSYIKAGSNIVLTGFPSINGFRVNNDPAGVLAPKFYTVTSVGQPVPGQLSYDAIVFTVNFTTFYAQQTPGGCSIEATEATMTTAAQIPNLEVGSQFQIAGTGGAPPSGYDNTWLVLETPNASQLQITSTSLGGNIATYGFNLITGTPPVVGQFVSIRQTLNGNGVFNVSKAIISSVTAGTFSIGLQGDNIASAAEDGSGIIFGTIFKFDAFVIIPNKFGVGTIVTTGTIGAGKRKICYSFLTRNGYMTQPSPIFELDVTTGASAIAVSNLLPGPSNTVARVIHMTGADGGLFYNIPVPVTVDDISGKVVNSSTYVNDNTSTSVTLSFSDDVLTGATQIDTDGNNLFETIELGAPVALIAYSQRLFAIGEQNKIPNLLNYSFDGGVGVIGGDSGTGGTGTNSTYPAGWTVDPLAGGGGSVVNSPIFGSAYRIDRVGGGPLSGVIGMITQPAFQDEFEVPIIVPSTTYSARITASAGTTGFSQGGNILVDLFSPSANRSFGTFSLDVSTLTGKMAVFTGKLLTTVFAPVPQDLLIRLYGNQFTTGTFVLIDRVEPFPTERPNLSTQLTGSYQGNFEAFDKVQGVVNAAMQNQQPIKSAFTLYDTLYMVKSGSLVSTQDNKTTEPAQWATPRVVSNLVGTTSIYGVDSGEEWAIIAGEPGGFIFNGGEPIKLTEEIQSAWNQINWKYGHTLWVKNDIVNRRILFGVPMKSRDADGNFPIWLPAGIIADDQNPTTPNVIIALNYKQLTTASALADRPEAHVSSFGGKLISTDMSRKWSIWTIKAPCADSIKRNDNTNPLFLGNSDATGKVYQLIPGLLEDDGAAIHQIWTSHAFPTPEQAQGLQLGAGRMTFEYMNLILDSVAPVAPWIASEPGAFVNNPALNSVYAKLPTAPSDFQGETASMFNSPIGPDHFVEATIAAIGPATPGVISDCGIAARMSIDPITGLISAYLFFLRHDGGVTCAFEVNVRPGQGFGAQTDFQRTDIPGTTSRFDVPYHVGSVMRMEVVENTITCFMDGIRVYGPVSGTLPGAPFGVTKLTAPNTGMEAYPAAEPLSSRFQLSNFRCGPLPNGAAEVPTFDGIGNVSPPPGEVAITVYPNSMKSSYAHALLPNLIAPDSSNGDVEVPINEVGNRMFVKFECNAVGSGFSLSRLAMFLRTDPWSPVRGRN